jgi:hypothetical protein
MTCPHCGETDTEGQRLCPRCSRPLLQPLAHRRYVLTDSDGEQFPLRGGVSRIGRDPASNEIVLADPSVSARHAAIEASPGSLILRDLGSTNGTWVNGRLLRQAGLVQHGDTITIGERELTVTRQSALQPQPPRGIPTPLYQSRQHVTESTSADHLSTAIAVIALTLLATILHTVAVADGVERDVLPAHLAITLTGLVVVPLVAIVLIAASRRAGYLVAAAASLIGLAFIAVTSPVFAGGNVRDEITGEYGSTGFWFVAGASSITMVVEILVLTVAIAGWRVLKPDERETQAATI